MHTRTRAAARSGRRVALGCAMAPRVQNGASPRLHRLAAVPISARVSFLGPCHARDETQSRLRVSTAWMGLQPLAIRVRQAEITSSHHAALSSAFCDHLPLADGDRRTSQDHSSEEHAAVRLNR